MKTFRAIFSRHGSCLVTVISVLGLGALIFSAQSVAAPKQTQQNIIKSLEQDPLRFEANQGQFSKPVGYVARGAGYTIFLTPDETVLALTHQRAGPIKPVATDVRSRQPTGHSDRSPPSQKKSTVVRMKLAGAKAPSAITPTERQTARTNYFIGNDKSKWRAGVPNYLRVRYTGVYPGIDVEYYGNKRRLEYDFIVAPGADPKVIALDFDGPEKLSLDDNGNLLLHVGDTPLVQYAPVIYQEIAGERRIIPGRYDLRAGGKVGFEIASYDRSRPLVIDPYLVYSTYLGGTKTEFGYRVVADDEGNTYVTGKAESTDFPITAGVAQTTVGGVTDLFVAKISPDGGSLIFATFLGGNSTEDVFDIEIDDRGNVFVVGSTYSNNYPTTPDAFQPVGGGLSDSFVSKLNSDGSALVYSTYLGGSGHDGANSAVITAQGNAVIAGTVGTSDFPITVGAFQETFGGGSRDSYVAKLSLDGSNLEFATFYGGTGNESSGRVGIDDAENVYVTGSTSSVDLPVSAGALQATIGSSFDSYVVSLTSDGSGLNYATYLGGEGSETPRDIAVDGSGNAYITGLTSSSTFPTTAGAFQTTYQGFTDAFVVKIVPDGTGLAYASYLGGGLRDVASGIAVDGDGKAYIAGDTGSANFPITPDAIQSSIASSQDAFVAVLSADGGQLAFSTFLGGSSNDQGRGVAVDSSGDMHIVGYAFSEDFPTTENALQPEISADPTPCDPDPCLVPSDAFVAKIALLDPPTNTPPIADAGPDQVLEATSAEGASAMLDGSGSSDPDGDPLTYLWSGVFGSVTGMAPAVDLPLGSHVIALEVNDGIDTANDNVSVSIVDTTPPTLVPPADVTATAEGPLTIVDIGVASASDLFGIASLTNDAPAAYPLGTTDVNWTAIDGNANQSNALQRIAVHYDFNGFLAPVDNPPVINSARSGGTVSLRWQIPTPSGDYIRDLAVVSSIQYASVACDDPGTAYENPLTAMPKTQTELKYQVNKERFVFDWQIPKVQKGSCYLFILSLNDGNEHYAKFELR